MKIERSHLVLLSLFSTLFAILVGILIVDSAGAENNKTTAQSITLIDNSQVQLPLNNALFLSTEIIFPEISAEFYFNGLGLKWQNKDIMKSNCSFFVKSEKTDWQVINAMEESNPQKSDYIFSDPVFVNGQKINLKMQCNQQINNSSEIFNFLQIIYFDSKPSYYFTALNNLKNASQKILGDNELNIITREQWGADESYRFWEPQYSDPKAFVIHHTAGGNGGDDPAATVRGVYYWHAVVLGWGDIGYNYLIDPAGNIYEGRYGGDKVIGAHTYNDVENANYNEETIGISILGCYEAIQPDCNTVDEFTPETQDSLKNLMAVKAKKLKIKLSGDRTIFSRSVKSIVGHIDLDNTLCPGNIIEDSLPGIRQATKAKYNQLVGRVSYRAKMISHDFADEYYLNEGSDIAITYQNKGRNAWLAENTYLKYYNATTKQESWISLEQDVNPNAEVTLNLTFDSGNSLGRQQIILELYQQEQYVYKSRKKIVIEIIRLDQAQFVFHNIPPAIKRSWEPEAQLTYKNNGKITWRKDDIKLFCNGKIVASLQNNRIKPQEQAVFNFILKQNNLQLGNNELIFYLKNNDERIGNSLYIRELRVDE